MSLRLIGAAFLLAMSATAAPAASLRPDSTLAGPEVRLSDLFDGVASDRVIGPAPQPGGRILVEAAQLAAIARQFGVAWRPASNADRIVLERDGRAFPRQDALAALRAALRTEGVPDDAETEMPDYAAPTVAIGPAHADVTDLEYSQTDGRFTALLTVAVDGAPPARTRLSGRVVAMAEVPVATKRLLPGELVAPGDVQMMRMRASLVRTDVAASPGQAIGMAMRHPIGPGAPFPLADLMRPATVERGQTVQMSFDLPGISISAQGTALESGANGEHVRVLNPISRLVIDAEVTGTGQVRVSGARPSALPANRPLPVRVAAQ